MPWQATPYAVPSLVAALVSSLLVAYVWSHRGERMSRVFAVLVAAIGAWSLVYAVQLLHTTLAEQLLWQRLGLVIGATIPTIWLLFALVYAGYEERLTPGVLALLLVDPVLFAILAWSTGTAGPLWTSTSLAPGLGLDLEFTAVYLVHISYAYLLVLAGITTFVMVFYQSSAIYRRQAGLMVVGAVVPLLANVAFTLGLSPVRGLDPTTTSFTVTGVVFALALFRFDLLDLTPVARRRVLDEFGSGLLVVDDDARVVHANTTARDVLPGVTIGSPVTETLHVDAVEDVDGLVSAVASDGPRRFYEFAVSSLTDFRDRRVGHVIALRDVTTSHEYEQRLEVANRLLRHNLQNDMNKILGWTDVARHGSDDEALTALDRIESVAEDVAAMSQKARCIEATLDAREGALVSIDVASLLRGVVDDVRDGWPEAHIGLTPPDIAPVLAPAGLLETAFGNLVENGVEHNDRDRPRVSIEVRPGSGPGGGYTDVVVADDGPGIPYIETSALLAEKESPLEHGSGLGLWLVRWIVETAGGELDVEANDSRGTVVGVRLRSA